MRLKSILLVFLFVIVGWSQANALCIGICLSFGQKAIDLSSWKKAPVLDPEARTLKIERIDIDQESTPTARQEQYLFPYTGDGGVEYVQMLVTCYLDNPNPNMAFIQYGRMDFRDLTVNFKFVFGTSYAIATSVAERALARVGVAAPAGICSAAFKQENARFSYEGLRAAPIASGGLQVSADSDSFYMKINQVPY